MKVSFVYAGGREGRLEAARLGNVPADFFYGAIEMERAGDEVAVFDLNPRASKIGDLFHRLLKCWLPPRTRVADVLAAGRLLPVLRGCDAVVATASGCAFALGIWKKWRRLPVPLVGIHCGIVNCQHAPTPRWAASWALKAMTPVLFSDNEENEIRSQFGATPCKPLWFGVDGKFWCPGPEDRKRRGVLAVGNDGRRDYETLLKTAALLPEVSFKIVTRISLGSNLPPNVEHIHGDWTTVAVSDKTLREFYREAACVAVPLRESVQPSGQSVAMQAMMCGAPVVMTRTSGWWGGDVLRPGKQILEVPPTDPVSFASSIRQALGRSPDFSAREALVGAGWTSKGFSQRLAAVVKDCVDSRILKKERTLLRSNFAS